MRYDCLIVDDERPLAESTAEYFNLFDVKTACVFDGAACLAFFAENTAEILLLDINLEGESGFALCRKLRETIDIPILFVSARSSDDDVLIALNIGGDDYIQKPCSLSVLLAKVKAVLKRRLAAQPARPQGLAVGELLLEDAAHRVTLRGEELRFKAMEYKLLKYLMENKGRVIGKEELFANVWEDRFTGDGTLNVHIRHLREKIEPDPNTPVLLRTVWGVGYILEDVGV